MKSVSFVKCPSKTFAASWGDPEWWQGEDSFRTSDPVNQSVYIQWPYLWDWIGSMLTY